MDLAQLWTVGKSTTPNAWSIGKPKILIHLSVVLSVAQSVIRALQSEQLSNTNAKSNAPTTKRASNSGRRGKTQLTSIESALSAHQTDAPAQTGDIWSPGRAGASRL